MEAKQSLMKDPMLDNKILWSLFKMFTTCVWGILIIFAFLVPSQIMSVFQALATIFLLIHLLELPFSLKISNEKGVPKSVAVIKTVCHGVAWWIPLKRGLIDE